MQASTTELEVYYNVFYRLFPLSWPAAGTVVHDISKRRRPMGTPVRSNKQVQRDYGLITMSFPAISAVLDYMGIAVLGSGTLWEEAGCHILLLLKRLFWCEPEA
jgi:hypothetical protein